VNTLLILLLVFIPVQGHKSEISSVPTEQFMRSYLQWFGHHRDAASGGKLLKLDMPAIDLYSPSGESLYYGTNSSENAAFLDSLLKGIPNQKSDVLRPSLKEAIEMVPEFEMRKDELLADKRYTVFAVTYPDSEDCQQQNRALAQLRAKRQGNVRVFEVRLTNAR
jgi:hypothetical protein